MMVKPKHSIGSTQMKRNFYKIFHFFIGMRMIQMIPTIMQNAHDKEKLMDMFRAEAENNWDQFVGRLDNSGTYDFSIKLTVSLGLESGKKQF